MSYEEILSRVLSIAIWIETGLKNVIVYLDEN